MSCGRPPGDHLRRGYFWLRLIVTIGWAIYPLGNFLTAFAGLPDDGSLSVAYNVADILNRMAFGVAVLATAVLVSNEAPCATAALRHLLTKGARS